MRKGTNFHKSGIGKMTKIDPPKLGENGFGRGGFSCRETRKGAMKKIRESNLKK